MKVVALCGFLTAICVALLLGIIRSLDPGEDSDGERGLG